MPRRARAPAPLQAPNRRSGRPESRALSPRDWADAALWAIGKSGLAGVTIDEVARTLGVTKGSFYWHFEDRLALLRAALERWEEICTHAIIERLEALERPRDRLQQLFMTVFSENETYAPIELAILSAAENPAVAPVVARVASRRLEYLVDIYRRSGLTPADARSAALLAYSAHLGLLQMARIAPDQLPTASARERYVRYLSMRLLPD
ncbi:TetR/AcrR family transcriptional regulator [Pendulispora brunnea]|uniref:TetR/AcrR family transcriptional regulator n=1 Tax=Pendulispora brunnea TaxID=2905690 RepID=A0ABZ2K8W1_9BACT